jgi:hypothetical protein
VVGTRSASANADGFVRLAARRGERARRVKFRRRVLKIVANAGAAERMTVFALFDSLQWFVQIRDAEHIGFVVNRAAQRYGAVMIDDGLIESRFTIEPAADLPGRERQHDVFFVPIAMYRTGECMVHEMVIDGPSVVFTNTLFSCLARAEGTQSFSQIMPEDRCHLNSFATEGKRIRYATAFSETDTQQGFRALPVNSGVVIDVEKNAILCSGLMRPHSVRLFDGKLFVLNSGVGEMLRVDPDAGTAERFAVLPGFTRGLRRHGNVLFVGLSTLPQVSPPSIWKPEGCSARYGWRPRWRNCSISCCCPASFAPWCSIRCSMRR